MEGSAIFEGEYWRWMGEVRKCPSRGSSYLGNRWGLELGKRQRGVEEEEGRSDSRAPIPPLGFRGWGTGMSLSLKFENRFCEMVTPLGGGESTERKQVFGMHQEGLCLNWELEPWAAQPRRRAGAWAGKPAPCSLLDFAGESSGVPRLSHHGSCCENKCYYLHGTPRKQVKRLRPQRLQLADPSPKALSLLVWLPCL